MAKKRRHTGFTNKGNTREVRVDRIGNVTIFNRSNFSARYSPRRRAFSSSLFSMISSTGDEVLIQRVL